MSRIFNGKSGAVYKPLLVSACLYLWSVTTVAHIPPGYVKVEDIESKAPQYTSEESKGHTHASETEQVNTQQISTGQLWELVSHEPTSFGYTFDGNDENYIDINISLKWTPAADDMLTLSESEGKTMSWGGSGLPYLYLAFTTRQAFYMSTRESSPVIGQRYNPEVFGRYWFKDGYLDFGYNHESNGQSINDQAGFLGKRLSLRHDGDDPDGAKEYISRGWDYWEVTWKKVHQYDFEYIEEVEYYLNGKYFVSNGLFQGAPEEVNEWETTSKRYSRSQVDGLSMLTKVDLNLGCNDSDENGDWFCLEKMAYQFTTGYDDIFEHDTNRIELGVRLFNRVPIGLWASEGYNNDLVDYYRRVKSAGVRLELGSF